MLDGVRTDMKVAREEIFGPVLSVMTFAEEAEAVRLANDTPYGLAAAVWTARHRTWRTASPVRCAAARCG